MGRSIYSQVRAGDDKLDPSIAGHSEYGVSELPEVHVPLVESRWRGEDCDDV